MGGFVYYCQTLAFGAWIRFKKLAVFDFDYEKTNALLSCIFKA
jgi:hypothetical protein